MKNKLYKILAILFAAFFVSASYTFAQKGNDRGGTSPKKSAAMFLNRTNAVLFETSKAVKENKVYTGYLKKAKDHQKTAINSFKNNDFKDAIRKSFAARRFAFLAFEANGKSVPEGWRLNQKEKMMIQKMSVTEDNIEELKKEVLEEDKQSEATVVVDENELPNVEGEEGKQNENNENN